MKPLSATRWVLSASLSLAAVSEATAATWYSAFAFQTATPALSRVNASGEPDIAQRFNTFNLASPRTLTVVRFYAPSVAPMYRVEVRSGGQGTGIIFRSALTAPIQVQPDPIFPFKVTVGVPMTILHPGTWSVSVATDSRFSSGPMFYSNGLASGWQRFIINGQMFVQSSSGLMIELADSL